MYKYDQLRARRDVGNRYVRHFRRARSNENGANMCDKYEMTMNSKFLLIRCAIIASLFGTVYGRFCSDVDVRENVSHFEKLAGCKVVVGYLQIVLFDMATVDTFQGITYPELEEITGYFLIFQVPGLLSIGRLFPNLRVIRGMEVIMNYSFMLYNVTDLMEVCTTI